MLVLMLVLPYDALVCPDSNTYQYRFLDARFSTGDSSLLLSSLQVEALFFGYDLAFVSGTFALPSFLRRFDLDTLSASHLQSNCLATFQAGAFFGVIILYWFNQKYGRRIGLILAGIIFDIGVILQMTPKKSIPAFYVGRILAGFGVGAGTYITPQYIAEVSPASARGGFVGFFEIGIRAGSMTGFWINYGVNEHISPITDTQWLTTIAMQFVPVTLMVLGLLVCCESPRWLYMKGRRSETTKALTWIRQLPALHPYLVHELDDYERYVKLLSGGVYSIIKGCINIFTMIFLIDRFGRRPLNLIGSCIIAFSMFHIAGYTALSGSFHRAVTPNSASKSALAFFYLYGASWSLGWGLVFIVCSEIYPNRIRAFCLAWSTCFHWIGEFYTSYAVAPMLREITYGTFIFFGVRIMTE
ncbi:general substrate transporter [Lophiotrema nucula]|uniref:General substrate transporter n=1 Tax=Lophiotrema nucula TaxID=690887 RepID=A0A6A5ZRM9_9PLEO|nr:general substrate transporter [Lophiotrema nucula]